MLERHFRTRRHLLGENLDTVGVLLLKTLLDCLHEALDVRLTNDALRIRTEILSVSCYCVTMYDFLSNDVRWS